MAELAEHGGAARAASLSAPRRELLALVEQGQLILAGSRTVALPGASRPHIVAAQAGGVITCVTAAREHGAFVPGPKDEVHIAVPRGRGSSVILPRDVVLHREESVESVGGGLASLEHATVRMVRCLPYDEAVAAIEGAAWRAGGRSLLERQAFVDRVLARLARGAAMLAAALGLDVDIRSRAPKETELRLYLRRAGLRVCAGVEIPEVGEVDLLVEGILVLEVDGWAYHGDQASFRKDRARDRRTGDLGFLHKRFAYEDSGRDQVLHEVLERLATATGPTPFSRDVGERTRGAVTALRAASLGAEYGVVGARMLRGRARDGVSWPPAHVSFSAHTGSVPAQIGGGLAS